MRLEFELTEVCYRVDVPAAMFAALERREDIDPGINHPTLNQTLDAIDGVRKNDYSGHFGPSIYVWLDSDFDNEETRDQISKVILKHLRMSLPQTSIFPLTCPKADRHTTSISIYS